MRALDSFGADRRTGDAGRVTRVRPRHANVAGMVARLTAARATISFTRSPSDETALGHQHAAPSD